MPIIYKLTLVNADQNKVWDKCREINLGHHLFQVGIIVLMRKIVLFKYFIIYEIP